MKQLRFSHSQLENSHDSMYMTERLIYVVILVMIQIKIHLKCFLMKTSSLNSTFKCLKQQNHEEYVVTDGVLLRN